MGARGGIGELSLKNPASSGLFARRMKKMMPGALKIG